MTFNDDDDYRFERDDDSYDNYDDDDKYRQLDDDDDSDEALGSGTRLQPRPFNSGLPGAGASRFGGGGTSSGSSSPFTRSGGTSPFGSSSPSSGSGSSGGTSSSGSGSGSSSSFGNRGSSSAFGGGGTSSGSGGSGGSSSSFGNRSGGSSSFGGGSPSTGGSAVSRPGQPAAGAQSSGSFNRAQTASSTTPARPVGDNKPASPAKPPAKDEEKKPGGMLGGMAGRFGLGGKKEDAGAKPPSIGSVASGNKPATKKEEGGGAASLFGKVTSALPTLPFGGKKDDTPAKPGAPKPAAKDGDKPSGGMLSGFTSRLPFGGKKDDAPKDTKKDTPASSGGSSGLLGRSGGTSSTAPASPISSSTSAATPAARPGAFESKTPAAAAAGAKSGGLFSRIGNFLRPPAEAPKPPARPRTNRAPVVQTDEGLTLDNWLDIIGVSLLGGALLLTLSSLSGEQAAIRGILRFLGELLGWGAFMVPLGMAVVGMWLIVRHFGDKAPSVDPIRVIGVIIAVLAILIGMQYIDSFSYEPTSTPGILELRLTYAWQELRAGGGAIGAQLYYFLIRNFTELGGVVVVILMLVVAGMLTTRSSASQMLTAIIGMGRNTRESVQRRAAAQRARRQLEMERRAAEQAQAQQSSQQLSPIAPVAVAEAPGIRINRGIDDPRAAAQAAPVGVAPLYTQAPVAAAPPPPPETGSGLFGRLGRFARPATNEPAPPPIIEPLPLDDTPPPLSVSTALGGLGSFEDVPSAPSPGYIPFERPAPAAPPSAPPAASAASAQYEEDASARSERLNALRNGNTSYTTPPTSQPPQPAASVVPPSQLPSVQPAPGPQQQMLNVPFSSPVVNHTRSQRPTWNKPDFRTLLSSGSEQEFDRELLLRQAKMIEDTLSSFGAPGRVVEVNTGPVITQFGVEPDYVSARGKKQRVKVGAIAALDKDLQLALGAKSIRVEAPVPGKGYVGIEVPNKEPATVRLRDVMESPGFSKIKSPLGFALGQSVSGSPISADLVSMPHILIAGTTGSGKSVMVNAIICSIIARHSPDTVKFIMVDPKRVELIGYNGIPHLVAPVVVELERIVGVLKWVTREMDDRYKKFSEAASRNIEDYNKNLSDDRDPMPYIVVIIDELADLMMQAPDETERAITRIAALARATGIHLVIATQRPSVDVVTGLIRANFPARIAFAVASGVDSRVILDQPGAEKLLGRGDMLYLSGDSPAALRLQGVFVSDLEINNLVRFWKLQAIDQPESKPFNTGVAPEAVRAMNPATITAPAYSSPAPAVQAPLQPASFWESNATPIPSRSNEPLSQAALTGDSGDDDDMYEQAVELVRRLEKASVSLLQRRLRIGYTRAARLIDMMEARGVVGPAKDGSSKPRDVLPLNGIKK